MRYSPSVYLWLLWGSLAWQAWNGGSALDALGAAIGVTLLAAIVSGRLEV